MGSNGNVHTTVTNINPPLIPEYMRASTSTTLDAELYQSAKKNGVKFSEAIEKGIVLILNEREWGCSLSDAMSAQQAEIKRLKLEIVRLRGGNYDDRKDDDSEGHQNRTGDGQTD